MTQPQTEMTPSNQSSPRGPLAVRWRVFIWSLATLFSVVILGLQSNQPSPAEPVNGDECFYGSIAVSYVTSGQFKAASAPDGMFKTGHHFAGHPQLYPYVAILSLKTFGVQRWALRLPSLVCFVIASVALLGILLQPRFGSWHFLAALLMFFLCPWVSLAGAMARPEMLSIAATYLAALIAIWSRKPYALIASGAFSAMAAFNHPIFIATAGLPWFIALRQAASGPGRWRAALTPSVWWGLGLVLGFGVLIAVTILPWWAAWQEQFVYNTKSFAEYRPATFNLFHELLDMKHRWSWFGWPYLNWYIGAVVALLVVLRATPWFLAAAGWLVAYYVYVEYATPVMAIYCIAFAAAAPLLLILSDERPVISRCPASIWWAALVAVLIQVPWTQWRVVRPNSYSREFSRHEQLITQTLEVTHPVKVICGPIEDTWPAWHRGLRFLSLYMPPLTPSREELDRYRRLIREQAEMEVSADGKVVWRASQRNSALPGRTEDATFEPK